MWGMSDDEEYAATPAYGGPPLPGSLGTNPPNPDPDVTFMLMSVPKSRETHEVREHGPSGLIQTIKELRTQFGLQLKPAVAFTRNTPCAITIDRQSVLEPKARALRTWGCVVALVMSA